MKANLKTKLFVGTALGAFALLGVSFMPLSAPQAQERGALLAGKVVSSTGAPLAGIPIKAHREHSPVTVAVYSDANGAYSFPSWSDVTPGSYSVAVELPDFQRTAKPATLADGKTA